MQNNINLSRRITANRGGNDGGVVATKLSKAVGGGFRTNIVGHKVMKVSKGTRRPWVAVKHGSDMAKHGGRGQTKSTYEVF